MSDTLLLAALALQHNPWHAQLYLATSVAITGTAWATIAYDSIAYDPAGMCTTGASAKITVPVSGIYLVTMTAGKANTAADGERLILDIAYNTGPGGSGDYRVWDTQSGGATGNPHGGGSIVLSMAAGDYVAGGMYTSVTGSIWGATSAGLKGTTTLSVSFLAAT